MMIDDTKLARNRKSMRAVLTALTTFRELSVSMPVGEVLMFLTVALNEGASLSELAETIGMKKSTASRYLLDLSDKTRVGGAGYGLVHREVDPTELRRNMYSITAKGRTVLMDMVQSTTQGDNDGDIS
jgi:DNA-binding MarR family transcriptional regulator